MTEQVADQRNRATIRDYVATLRRRKLVILGTAVLAALVAGAISLAQPKSYTATASLNALDISQSAAFAGLQQAQQNLPQTTAAQLAEIATRNDVLAAVKARLGLRDSIARIRSRLSVSENQQSNFVQLTATASTPAGAAALANATADAVVRISNQQQRAYYAHIAARDGQQAAALLLPYVGKSYGQLSPAQQAAFQADNQRSQQLAQLAARIQAFSNVVTVAQVAAPASAPSAPSSPHPLSSALIGAAVGLVLGLLLTWFLESLDRRLRRPDEAEAILGMPIVGAVPTGDLGKVPDSPHHALTLSSFRMVRTNVRFLAAVNGQPPRSILVTSALSEEGKTTVAIGLAMSAAAAGVNTLLIEADVHRPVHHKRLGLAAGPGLADYLHDSLAPAQILQVHTFIDPLTQASNGRAAEPQAAKLTCITAGNVGALPPVRLGSQLFATVIAEVSRVYELVVIDTAPLLAVPETLEMMTFVDAAVLCVRLGRTTVEQARNAHDSLARLPGKAVGLVLTDIDPGVGGYYGYTYAYDYSLSESRAAAPSA